MTTEVQEEMIEEIEEISIEIQDLEKCIKQLVQSAVRNAKFHSNHLKASQFTVEIVI
jgi:uncharacterized protein YggE